MYGYKQAVKMADRPFRPVYLTAAPAEIARRLELRGARSIRGRKKPRYKNENNQIVHYANSLPSLFRFSNEGIEIDTTNKSARETALAILDHVYDLEKGVTCDDAEDEKEWALVSHDLEATDDDVDDAEDGWMDVKCS